MALFAAFRAEVDRDRARGDVHPLADVRVANVAEVVYLGARPNAARLHFGVVAERHTVLDDRPGPQMTERSDRDALANDRALEHREPHARFSADLSVRDIAVGSNLTVAGDARASAEVATGLDDRVRRDADFWLDERRCRINDRHTVSKKLFDL